MVYKLHKYLYFYIDDSSLQVMVNNGLSNKPEDFELCLRVGNVVLPQSGYLGVSAATGGLAGSYQIYETNNTTITEQYK